MTVAVMTGLHVGRISGAVVGMFLAAAFGAALAEARRINLSGDLSRGLDELFTLPPSAGGDAVPGLVPGPPPGLGPSPSPGTP
jgi:hypothetical protein